MCVRRLAGGDAAKIEAMAADVAAHPDAGAVALRESKFAWAKFAASAGPPRRCRETV
ncbi:MAG: hypothetical protein ACLRSE_09530 [Alistipes finegoldii]